MPALTNRLAFAAPRDYVAWRGKTLKSRIGAMNPKGRFVALLAAEAKRRKAYDRPLLETAEWVVAPTLGAIVPNWLIIIPRRPALNFHGWYRATGTDPHAIVTAVCKHVSLAGDKALWFEHGPKIVGTAVGCGTDYAHLHVILDPPFSFETFMAQVESSSALNWKQVVPEEAYDHLTGQYSYLVVGMGDRAAVAEVVELTGSQFLRRMVGTAVGKADEWNYRHHPHEENIARTIETFRALENAAQRGK
jgi:hypothetical protein